MRFEAQKRTRLHRYFLWYTIDDNWYIPEIKKWMPFKDAQATGLDFSTCCYCKTLRAFQRHCRKHNLKKKNAEVILVNRYVGFNVFIKNK